MSSTALYKGEPGPYVNQSNNNNPDKDESSSITWSFIPAHLRYYVSRPAIDFWPTDHKLDGLYTSGAQTLCKDPSSYLCD